MDAIKFVALVKVGQGWTTDGYVENFFNGSNSEKYKALLKLAQLGILYNEHKLSDGFEDDGSTPPSNAKLSVKDVENIWKSKLTTEQKLRKLIRSELKNLNESVTIKTDDGPYVFHLDDIEAKLSIKFVNNNSEFGPTKQYMVLNHDAVIGLIKYLKQTNMI